MLDTIKTLNTFFKQQNLISDNGFENLSPNFSLLDEGLIDSINLMKLISFIEEKFNITIDEAEMTPENFDTLNSLGELITKKYINNNKKL